MPTPSATRILVDKARKNKFTILWPFVAPLTGIVSSTIFDGLSLDAALVETHGQAKETTSHPIELGVEISDHVIKRPFTLDVEGVLTNTPIQLLASIRNPRRRANSLFEKILELHGGSYLATVYTGLNYYDDMLLLSYSVPRTASTSDGIFLNLSFKQIIQVESKLVEAPEPKVEKAKPRKSLKRKGKKTATEPKASAATHIWAAIKG